ncbi:MAG: hypothetical protein GEU80_06790 [Dehalococcoidia bacterium]|nr:hypothetical protein [Dehalococcoidia bacterium]
MNLLLDQMWPPALAAQLGALGFDVSAVAEREDLRGQSDEVVFAAAQKERRALVTENVVDLRPIASNVLRNGGTHCGVVFTTDQAFPRGDPRTFGHMLLALEMLLDSAVDLTDKEHWLR